MRKKFKRAISIVLSIAMIATMFCTALSVSAVAGATYVLAGDIPGLSGSWDPSAKTGSVMNDNGDGTYSLTIKDVPAGTYGCKVTDGNGWNNCWGDESGGNVTVNVNDTCDITVTFDSYSKKITVKIVPNADYDEETTAEATKEPSDVANINGVAAHIGDTISYTAYLQADEKLINLQATTYYDSSMLELIKPIDRFIAFPVNPNAVYNENLDGMVKFNDSNLYGIDFTTKGVFVKLDFKVVGGGTSAIRTVIEEMNSIYDKVYAERSEQKNYYSFTETVAVIDGNHTETTEPTAETTKEPSDPSDVANINGVTAHIGDTISYTAYLQADEKLINLQATTYYDSSMLELIKPLDRFIAFPVDPNVVYNENLDGMVKFNDSNLYGIDFTTKGVFVKLDFKVVGGGTSAIRTVIEEMNSIYDKVYAERSEQINYYSFTETVTVIDCNHTETTEPTEPVSTEPSDVANINGVTAHIGDTISYTAYLQADEKLINLQATTYYDSSMLELIKPLDRFIAFPVDPNVIYNENLDGMVKFNDSNLYGIDFTTKGVFVKLDFKVVGGGTSAIRTVIEEMNSIYDKVYAERSEQINYYSFTETAAVIDCNHTETTEPTEPVSTEPVSTEPVSTEPTEPVSTEPVSTEPVSTEPVSTEPVSTEPVSTEPVSTEPVSTEPSQDPANAPAFVISDKTAKIGSTFTVDLSVINNPGITALSVKIDYPTDVLTLKNVEYKNLFSTKATGSKNMTSPFTISWFSTKSIDETANGVLATLTFEVKQGAQPDDYPITLTYNKNNVINISDENVYFAVENGMIKVVDYTPGDVSSDGVINMKDLAILQQFINGWDIQINEEAADINSDGEVGMKDIVLLQKYLNGWNVEIG